MSSWNWNEQRPRSEKEAREELTKTVGKSKSLVRNFERDVGVHMREKYAELSRTKLGLIKLYPNEAMYSPHYVRRRFTLLLATSTMTASELGKRYYETSGSQMGWVLLQRTIEYLIEEGYVEELG